MKLGDLALEVARDDPLAERLEASHFGFDAASAMIAAPSSPDGASETAAGAQRLVADMGAGRVLLPRLAILARRDDRLRSARGDGGVT